MQHQANRETFSRLWDALRGPLGPPSPGGPEWDALALPGELPSPWTTWTLVALFRHRRRQLWVGQVVDERLGGDLGLIAKAGAMGHPDDRPQRGVVPGLPEWEYFFHGCGCCLTHRVTGEAIDVDFDADDAENFDVYFFEGYLKSLRDPPLPERRLIDLHPSFEAVILAFDELRAAGVLVGWGHRKRARLSPAALAHEPAVDAFCDAFEDPARRTWLSALVGDWPAVEQSAAGHIRHPRTAGMIADRAAAVRRLRTARLVAGFEAGDRPGACLHGLAEVAAPELPTMLVQVLRGEVQGGVTSAAVDIINARPDAAAWCPELFALFNRLNPGGQPPHPYLWSRLAGLLLEHGYRTPDVAAALPRASSHVVGDAAVLALIWLPDLAPDLLRRALRSDVPANRCTAAAALALIDQPWSRAELLAVLAESDDQLATSDCRAALAESRDPDARAAVLQWEAINPHEPEPGPWISSGEMLLRQNYNWLRHEMDELRDRLAPVIAREARRR